MRRLCTLYTAGWTIHPVTGRLVPLPDLPDPEDPAASEDPETGRVPTRPVATAPVVRRIIRREAQQ